MIAVEVLTDDSGTLMLPDELESSLA